MKYKEARPMIKSGDIIAFSHMDLASQVIRAATRSQYSHVGIAWSVAGRLMILEAVNPMIRIYPLSMLLPFYWVSIDIDLNSSAEEFALSRVGERYSVSEAVLGFLGMNKADNKWQCAEYVKSVLDAANYNLPGNATPSDVVTEALNKDGDIYIVQ